MEFKIKTFAPDAANTPLPSRNCFIPLDKILAVLEHVDGTAEIYVGSHQRFLTADCYEDVIRKWLIQQSESRMFYESDFIKFLGRDIK